MEYKKMYPTLVAILLSKDVGKISIFHIMIIKFDNQNQYLKNAQKKKYNYKCLHRISPNWLSYKNENIFLSHNS